MEALCFGAATGRYEGGELAFHFSPASWLTIGHTTETKNPARLVERLDLKTLFGRHRQLGCP